MNTKSFFVLLALFFSTFFVAQIDVLKQSLLTLEQQVFEKNFTKKWVKTTQKNWESKCNSATNIDDLATLFNQWSDLFAQVTNFSMGNVEASNAIEFANYLIKVKKILKPEYISKWSIEDQTNWELNLREYLKDEQIKLKKIEEEARQIKRLMYITNVMKLFDENLLKVWEDSKKNSFNSLRASTPTVANNNSESSLLFNNAAIPTIERNENGTMTFRVVFECMSDKQLADKVMIEMIKSIKSIVPSNYVMTNTLDAMYKNGYKQVFELNADNINDIARNSTLSIGVFDANNSVVLEVCEPVNKRK